MDKRKGYSLGHPERTKDKEVYTVGSYDNGTYVSEDDRQGQGVRYPSTSKDTCVAESQFGTFQHDIPEAGNNTSSSRSSSNRRYILIAVVLITAIVAIAVAAAVVATLLLNSDNDSMIPETEERKVEKTVKGEASLNSKTWTDAFKNKNSIHYKSTEKEFVDMMDKTLQNSSLADKYNWTVVTNMRQGSVIVVFDAVFTLTFKVIVDDNNPSKTTQTLDGRERDSLELNLQVDLVELKKIITENEEIDDAIVSDYDECGSNPCQNEGICNDGVYKFTCKCKAGYIGITCEEEDNCQNNSCKNGAICRDDDDDFTCECMPGYTGKDCGDDINECVSGPCQNEGKCEDKINRYDCYCLDGFTGDNCQKNIDDCGGNLCVHGNCVDEVNGYSCLCENGWIGGYCKEDYNECIVDNPCKNSGLCQNIDGTYLCICLPGWAGQNCDININECHFSTSPCINGGTCIDTEGNYTCVCPEDWSGSRCETDFQSLTSNPTTITTRSWSTSKTTTQERPYTGNKTTTEQPQTTGYQCGTADKFVYQIDGVILSPYDTNLDDYDSPRSREKGKWLIESMRNATVLYGLTVCDLYLKGFYPVDSSSIPSPLENDQKTGFTVTLITFSAIREQDVKYLFIIFLSDQFLFTSMIDFRRSTSLPTIATTTYSKETCSNHTTLVTYSFNMTYLEPFTDDLFNFVSDAFRNLNKTLSGLFLESARNESDDQWICIISLINCVPTSGNFTTVNELFISAEVLISVPVNTITINEAAYHFSQAALKSGILFLIDYRVYNIPNTTSSRPATTSNRPSTTYCYFRCFDDKKCITFNQYCDGVSDCVDGSDETTCTTPPTKTTTTVSSTTTHLRTVPYNDCNDNEFPCLDGYVCIPADFVCDGYKDCSENEDERGCDCPETYCKFDGNCITEEAVCDGVLDCKDQTDEHGCPVVCTPEQFTCKLIKECIDVSLKCDNKKDCKDGTDEWYDCSPQTTPSPSPKEYELRLMNGDADTTRELYGRVEVRLVADGKPISEFGTICDDSWDKKEAIVLCRYLGASDPLNSFAYSQARFGEGIGPIWLRNFHCNGSEQKIQDCVASEWGQTHCSHHQDASISCDVDRLATATTTGSSLNTADPTLTLPNTSPIPEIGIRVVDGENCLEGRIEVFRNGKWGTVCSNGFGYMEAYVVCKILGFSTYKTYNSALNFGSGTGPIHLSNLNCNGSENSISECEHIVDGELTCSHHEDQGVRCLGDPDIDCKTESDVPNVNCTFERSRCAYQMEVLSGNGNWWWTISSAVGVTDVINSSSSHGRLMIYQNAMGSEGDKAILMSPSFIPKSVEMKVEFYYQLQESYYKDLTLSIYDYGKPANGEENDGISKRSYYEDDDALETNDMWNSQYLRRDQENQWLYECVQLTELNISSNYSLVFTAKNGPSTSSVVALDEILVSKGVCSESLLDEICTFERPRSCGMTVDCLNCDRTKLTFSWIWQNNGQNGRYMVADSTFGSEGNEAVMSFAVPSLDNRRSITFLYNGFGKNKGNLEILVKIKDTFHSTLSTISSSTNSWSKKCIQLPADIDSDVAIVLIFKVVHVGGGNEGFIAVDNINLSAEECPHPLSACVEDEPQCGWTTISNGPFEWKYIKDSEGNVVSAAANIRLTDGPDPSKGHVEILHNDVWGRVCDDGFGTAEATVVCKMLGYPTQKVEYLEESPYGYSDNTLIWLDELSCTGEEESLEDCDHDNWGDNDCSISEHVAVHCYGVPSGSSDADFKENFFMLSDQSEANSSLWTAISSSTITHASGEYRFVFDMLKSGFELIQVWYLDLARNKTQILDKIFTPTHSVEQYCIEFADITGEISVGLTAFRLAASTVKTFVANFSVEQGICKESPAKRKFTFERDHMFYGYDVLTEADDNVCVSSYKWERMQAEDAKGYFMYVNPLYGESGDTSSITLNQITSEESKGLCSLKFSYFVNGSTKQRYLGVFVNSKAVNLYGIPKVRIWISGCVSLVDKCGEDPGMLDIKFHAADVEAGVDDIVLTTDQCPEPEEATVDCNFEKGTTCGYVFDPMVWSHEKLLIIVSPDPGRYLVSPLFDTAVESCVKIAFSSTSEHFVRLMVVRLDGETVVTTELLVPSSSSREIHQDIKTGSNLRLYFEAYYTNNEYVFDKFALTSISLEEKKCEKPGLSCDFVMDIECDGECISPDKRCDGIRQCADGKDEQCDCDDTTIHCKLGNECIVPAVQCDGFSDCTDGSDEDNCEPSVSCSFNQSRNFYCGYFLYNAEPGYYSRGLKMTSQLAYITSPDVTIKNDSCLSITAEFSAKSNIRVSSFDGVMFTVLHQESRQHVELTILVNVSVGYYKGLTIETRSDNVFGNHVVGIKEILLTEKACGEETEIITSPTKPSTTAQGTKVSLFDFTVTETTIKSSTTKSHTSEQSTTKLPDDFPELSVTEPDPVELGGDVKLSCYVKHGIGYQLILSWLAEETEIFWNGELMLEEENRAKYSIYMNYNNTGTIYDLTVNGVKNDDINKAFTCIADVVGRWPSNILKTSTIIRKADDGCFALGNSDIEKFCETNGYDKVTTPTISGFQTMDDIYEAFDHLQNKLDNIKHDFNDKDQCYYPLHELICGLYASKCDSGNVVRPICREHCEEISDACMSVPFSFVYDNNTVADHFCKYLSSKEDLSDCTEIWLGCGANITLGKNSTPSFLRLRSNNYPNRAPDVSPCVYQINTSAAYFSLQLLIKELVLGDDCNTSYLMINEDRLCSSNTSQFTLSPDQTYVKLSLVSSPADLPTGFLISFDQEYPVSLCAVFEVKTKINTYETKSGSSSCTEWVFTTNERGYSISLIFTELLDCVDVLDKDSNFIQEVCDLETKVDLNRKSYVKLKSRTADNIFKLKYSLVSSTDDYNYTITSVELREGYSANEGKVYITRSDGKSGYLCGRINLGAANLICRLAGFGSPSLHYLTSFGARDDINTKDIIIYNIDCTGNEYNINECKSKEWVDTCEGYQCSCYVESDFRGVRCPFKTVQCEFTDYDCGYEYDRSVVTLDNTHKFGGGLYMTGSSHRVTEIHSPSFTYITDSVVTFDYSFEGVPGENLTLTLRTMNGSGNLLLWQKPQSTLEGLYRACVKLPEAFANQIVQMIFAVSMTTSIFNNKHTIGLQNVTIDASKCAEEFPTNKCTFNNIDVCQKLLLNTCLNDGFGRSVWSVKYNRLEGNSAYAMQDVDYAVTFTSSSTDNLSYLRFKYIVNGVGVNRNGLSFRVDFGTELNDVRTIFLDNTFKKGGESVCLSLPSNVDAKFQVNFVLSKSTSEGIISLDDIELSQNICPHPISCDFEEHEKCNYKLYNHSSHSWIVTLVDHDHTFGGHSKGHVIQVDTDRYPLVNGHPAVFTTQVAQLNTEHKFKCLSFFYKQDYESEGSYRLDVSVSYPESGEIFTREVMMYIPYVWQEVNVKLDPDKYSNVGVSFKATYIHGYLRNSLAIDDIKLLTTDCIDGLQDLAECDFSNAGLCGFETNCTVNSGYSWRIISEKTNTNDIGTDGHYMLLDSSFGAEGNEAFMWFKVNMKSIEVSHYSFSYYMSSNGTGMLRTFYRQANTNTYSGTSVVEFKGAGIWLQSECYQLSKYFRGEIYFHAVKGNSGLSDIAVDNVKITRHCEVPSVACDFVENACGYTSVNSVWTLKDGYIITEGQGSLSIPVDTVSDRENACIVFAFESENTNALIVETVSRSEHNNYTYMVYSNGQQRGQINYVSDIDDMKFVVPGKYLLKIDQVTITPGPCEPMSCKEEEFVCPLQCIPAGSKCDRKLDCNHGQDEAYCGFSFECQFNDGNDCGYIATPESKSQWSVKESHTFILDGMKTTVKGGMLYTNLKGQSYRSSSSAGSTWHRVTGSSCIRFRYLGTVPFLVATISDKEIGRRTVWNDTRAAMIPTSWRTGQIGIETNSSKNSWIMLTFTAVLLRNDDSVEIDKDPFIAIDDIELLHGPCEEQNPPFCPEVAPLQCDDFSHCYTEELKCDKKKYCPTGSDESLDLCASVFKIECDFERDTLCGYEIISNTYGKKWRRVGGNWYQIPPFDHTRQDDSGHFLLFVNWDNNHAVYESTTAISPVQEFPQNGCVTFWYYLNSTAVQPAALSAQIMASVYYINTSKTEYVWYDFVNRPIDGWILGNFEVPGNQKLSVNFTAITSETYLAYPGVVGLDDVSFNTGKCPFSQECSDRTFSCKESGLCIPKTFICDGKNDCRDESDEENCDSRPNGKVQLVGGDGKYGQLQYYLDGSWRAVCFPSSDAEDFNYIVTQRVCEQLGFVGKSEAYEYKLRHTISDPVSITCDDNKCSHTLCSVRYRTTFAAIKCSNSVCFSGTRICPGTTDVCRPSRLFCNGNPDCPNNTDETECCCHEGDEYCTRTPDESKDKECVRCKDKGMFECQSHQCISKDKVCDGKKDCVDGMDEYRCVRIKEAEVTIYYESEVVPVCYNDIGRQEAETLCSSSGRGLLANRGIQRGYTEVNGVMLTKRNSLETILPGLDFGQKRSCYPLILKCRLPECGTSSVVDDLISPLIPHGNKAVLGARPYHASLRKDNGLHCGCTLIGGRWALTAAHCVEYKASLLAYAVIVGSIESDNVGEHGQQFSVQELVSHPNYNKDDVSKGYDVALIKLAHAPNFDNYTRPACLGTKTTWQYVFDLGDKAECYITGFGANELYLARGDNSDKVLAESRVGIIDRETCITMYAAAGTGNVSHDGICVENRQPYQAACYGDSGGPFVCRNEIGRWELFGDLSYGSTKCDQNTPSIYFDVTSQRDWIKSVTGLDFQDEYSPVYDGDETP